MQRTDGRGVGTAFVQGKPACNSNSQLFSPDGVTVYSYGAHWPIAAWIDNELVMHKEKRSVTTSKHTSYIRTAAAYLGLPIKWVETRRELLALQGKAFL